MPQLTSPMILLPSEAGMNTLNLPSTGNVSFLLAIGPNNFWLASQIRIRVASRSIYVL